MQFYHCRQLATFMFKAPTDYKVQFWLWKESVYISISITFPCIRLRIQRLFTIGFEFQRCWTCTTSGRFYRCRHQYLLLQRITKVWSKITATRIVPEMPKTNAWCQMLASIAYVNKPRSIASVQSKWFMFVLKYSINLSYLYVGALYLEWFSIRPSMYRNKKLYGKYILQIHLIESILS